MNRRPLALSQPFRVLSWLKNARLPVVNLGHLGIWIRCNDGESIFPMPGFWILPRSQMPAIPRTFLPLDDSRYFGRGSGAVFFHSKKELTGMIAAIVYLLFPRMKR